MAKGEIPSGGRGGPRIFDTIIRRKELTLATMAKRLLRTEIRTAHGFVISITGLPLNRVRNTQKNPSIALEWGFR